MRLFYFQCGHQAETTAQLTKTSLYSGRQCCPKCGKGFIMAIRCYCETCGGEMGILGVLSGSRKRFCNRCLNVKRTKAKMELIKKGKASGKSAPPRYPDCKQYAYCLSMAAYSNKPLKCKGCEKYAPVERDITSFIDATNPTSQTKGIFSNIDPGMGRIW